MRKQIDAAIRDWFRQNCTRGPLARDTEAYNQVFAALPDLTAHLAALLPPQSEPAAAPAATKPEEEH